jgi:hypothetical protein
MDYLLLSIGIVLILSGLVGCILPALPGPPLSYFALVTIYFTRWGPIENKTLIILGALVLIVTILDYIVPAWGSKKFGGSKRGIWGATIGLIVGLFLGPIGIIIGPFAGAFIGELTNQTKTDKALRAALGSLIGVLTGIVLKLVTSGIITFYFVKTIAS